MSTTTKVTFVRVPEVSGRPLLSDAEPAVGARGLAVMAMLVRSAAALAGLSEVRVDRSAVTIRRVTPRRGAA